MKKLLNVLALTLVCLGMMACSRKDDSTKNSDNTVQTEQTATTAAMPKIIDFSATWCPPCQQLKPIYEKLAEEYEGKVEMISIDVDENSEMAAEFHVESIPTLVYFNEKGEVVNRTVGLLSEEELKINIESLLTK